jgi:phosphohistidine swiveling domain-containing protein
MDGSGIPLASSGKRMTITFWMYINDLTVNQGRPRRVFNRGSKTSQWTESSPYIVLNDKLNKLHVIFHTTDSSQYMSAGKDFSTQATNATEMEKIAFLSAVHGITIDYIPMQRWVHVGIVVNEESRGGVVMAYLDGELVKTVTTSTAIVTTDNQLTLNSTVLSGVKLDIQNLDLNLKSNVFVGGDATIPGFSGLVSTIGFTSSDLNADDIYRMYLQGPISGSVLTKLGLPAYGLQSPIYRVG